MNDLKNLYKVEGTYYIRYRVNGKLIRYSLHTTCEEEAIKKRDEIYESVKGLKTRQDLIVQVAKAKKLYTSTSFFIEGVWEHFENYLERYETSALSMKIYKTRLFHPI